MIPIGGIGKLEAKIVIINGQGGAGKDTFINFCGKYTQRTVCNISSVAPIKEVAKMLDWNGEKDKKGRKLLSDLKRVSKEYNNFPVKYMLYSIKRSIKDYGNPLIFLHIREIDEITEIKEILSESIALIVIKDMDKHGNNSDDDVYNYNYDHIVYNNWSLENLEHQACLFVKILDTGGL